MQIACNCVSWRTKPTIEWENAKFKKDHLRKETRHTQPLPPLGGRIHFTKEMPGNGKCKETESISVETSLGAIMGPNEGKMYPLKTLVGKRSVFFLGPC